MTKYLYDKRTGRVIEKERKEYEFALAEARYVIATAGIDREIKMALAATADGSHNPA